MEKPTFEPLPDELVQKLNSVSTATLTSQLHKHGYRNTFMTGILPLRPDLRLCGRAVTLRYIPMREDLGEGMAENTNAQRRLIESIGQGEVLVIDAREQVRAGTIGNILTTRIMMRGGAGLISDGCFRDYPAIQAMDFPTYARGRHAGFNTSQQFPIEFNQPIGCGGVAVLPGDVLVGDGEGVVVIPYKIVNEIADAAYEQERMEDFIVEKIQNGSSILGVYPPGPETKAEFERRNRRG